MMRSQGQMSPVAAVYQRQLSVPPLRGQSMSSSLQDTGWRPSVADWGGGISVVLHRWSSCPLSQPMDGWTMCHSTTSSCQSAAAHMILKHCCSQVFLCKQSYGKYSDFYLSCWYHCCVWCCYCQCLLCSLQCCTPFCVGAPQASNSGWVLHTEED